MIDQLNGELYSALQCCRWRALCSLTRADPRVCAMKFLPLVWAALWRNRAESVLTLLALSVAFALFGTMVAVHAAYERAIVEARADRLIVACAFDCGAIPLGYGDQIARIAGVTGVGGQLWLGGYEQDARHRITVMFVDEGLRAAWPELPMNEADWDMLEANPSGVFLTRTAAARHDVRIGDRLTLTTAPGSRADGGGTWFFTVLGFRRSSHRYSVASFQRSAPREYPLQRRCEPSDASTRGPMYRDRGLISRPRSICSRA